MKDIIDIIDLVIILWGAVLIYAALSSRITGTVLTHVLWDRKTPFSKCRHKKEFIKYVGPRMFVTGIVVLAFGVFGMLTSYHESLDKYYNVGLVITLAVFVWYSYCSYLAQKKYY